MKKFAFGVVLAVAALAGCPKTEEAPAAPVVDAAVEEVLPAAPAAVEAPAVTPTATTTEVAPAAPVVPVEAPAAQ